MKMQKIIVSLIFIMILHHAVCAADTALFNMTQDSSPGLDSIFYSLDDPSGTPVDRKVTLQHIADAIHSDLVAGDIPDISETYLTLDGNGSALTNLSGTAITVGTVSESVIDEAITRDGDSETITGDWTFTGANNTIRTVTARSGTVAPIISSTTFTPATEGGDPVTDIFGVFGSIDITGSEDMPFAGNGHTVGLLGHSKNSGTGTIGLMIGAEGAISAANAGGTTTAAACFYGNLLDGTGPITSFYGLYFPDIDTTNITNAYSFYSYDAAMQFYNAGDLTFGGTLYGTGNASVYLKEKASATPDVASYGQIWIKSDTPNTIWFTDDAGTDHQLGAASAGVEDAAYGSGWNGDTSNAPSQNALYDYLILFDTDADGDFTDEAWFSTGGAPTDAYYLTSQADGTLSNEQVVSANGLSLVTAADYAAMKGLLDTDDIQTLTGIAAGSANLGSFTGTTITDDQTIKAALQEIETAVEGLAGGHDAVTIGTANGLSLSSQEISLAAATSGSAGAMTAAQVTALEAIDTEAELEALLDLQDLQGSVIDAQIPASIARTTELIGSDEAYGSSWAANNTLPEKDDIYDYLVQFDADNDGDFTNEGWFTGLSGTYQPLDTDLSIFAGITPSTDTQSFLSSADYAAMKGLLDTDDIQTLTGIAAGSAHLGTFTGTTITDDSTIKAALQEIETAVEGLAGGHDAVTIGTANGLSLSSQEISLAAATSGSAGAMTAAQVTALEAIDTEAELEALLDLQDLQGSVTDAQVPDDITITETDPNALLTAGTDNVKDTHIDWGTGAGQVSAVDIEIADSGDIITGTTVEAALQENRTAINLNTAKTSYTPAEPGEIGGTTPAAATFTTLSAGSAGFTVDADGDMVAKSVSITASASPGITANDSDAPGTDKEVGKLYWDYIDGADGAENADSFWQAMQGGAEVTFIQIDESDDQVEIKKALAAEAGVVSSNGSVSAGFITLYEDSDDGSNYTKFQVQAQAGDVTYTLPAADGSSGQVIKTNGSGVLSWADDSGAAGGDSISVDSSAVVDPDFVSTGDIDFVDTDNTITANLNDDVVGSEHMADQDHGDISWSSGAASIDAGTVGTTELANDAVTMDKIDDDGNFTSLTGNWYTTGELNGKLDITDHTSTGSISAQSCYGGVVTNTGAGDAIVLTLPDAVKGMSVLVVVTAAQDIDVNPNGSERILVDTDADGDALSSDATIGSFLAIIAVSDTQWLVTGKNGTWTDAN